MAIRDEDRSEAERLALLPVEEQRQIVETIRSPGDDPEVSAEHRREARRRAKALSELLKLETKAGVSGKLSST